MLSNRKMVTVEELKKRIESINSFLHEEMKNNVVGTYFVLIHGKLVRALTTLHKETGALAIGTELEEKNAASALLAGKEYSGEVELFGKKYNAVYKPIKDGQGKVIGAYFAAESV